MTQPNADPGSLDRLHDIVLPPPAAWWPPAPAWYTVGAVALIAVCVAAWVAARHWHRNRYRRAAVRELDRLPPDDVPALAALVKRTALVAFPREQVASLTGEPWLQFLNTTGRTDAFTRPPGLLLGDAEYRANPMLIDPQSAVLTDIAREWIRTHRVGVP